MYLKSPFLISRETVSLLIDNGEATSIEEKAALGDSIDNENIVYDAFLFYHQAIRAYWSGYTDQCRYYCEKHLSISSKEMRFLRTQVEFYHGKEAGDLFMDAMKLFSPHSLFSSPHSLM